jgi:hypothetical protein
MKVRRAIGRTIAIGIALIFIGGLTVSRAFDAPQAAGQSMPAQKIDQDYTNRILANTPDKRILTEFVDHMPLPADPNVPSPLKFLGYVPGENNKLTYHKDIVRYLEALQKASPRVKLWSIGKTEEGRDMVAVAIADEATIKNLQHYKDITAQLTDPRKTNETVAKQLIATGKPIYYANGSIHTPETGSPEMLMELAYRLAIEETPFIQQIRNNIIVVLTPASEVDGREKVVDGQRATEAGQQNPGLAYWGHYVQHDNNRDGIGKGLNLTNNILKTFLDLHPTVFHDLHESVDLLYVSTGTGPYNPIVAPIQVTEWWWLAQNEIMEMTKRGVPGVWTYDYYDGWVPNYLFWIGVTHNSIGRFYETQSYGGGGGGGGRAAGAAAPGAAGAGAGAGGARGAGAAAGGAGAGAAGARGAGAAAAVEPPPDVPAQAQGGGRGGASSCGPGNFPAANSREWYRVDPNPGCVGWSGRANINMQESAILITMNTVAHNKEKFLENYYVKNKQMIEQGKSQAPYAYVIPAKQRRQVEAADFMNLLRREGLDVNTATQAFQIGSVLVTPGDYIVRMDQPYRGLAETLLGVQWYPAENPRPYDDTGWDIPVMRNVKSYAIADKAIFDKPMTLAMADFKAPGTITGTGSTIVIDHTTDNTLVTFAFQNKSTKMQIAEQAFDMGGHHFAAGAFVIANASRPALESQIRDLGLMAWATNAAPSVPMHDLTLPRIGYIHSWTSTQDEGWVRMAFDKLKVPYEYFGDNLIRKGNLRAKYDVIIYPSTNVDLTATGPSTAPARPYKKTDITPNIGTSPDNTDDINGGLGQDGLKELVKFMNDGGLVITEGGTSSFLTQNGITSGMTIDQQGDLYAPGSVIKTMLGDKTSPVLYGYDQNSMGTMFKSSPLFGLTASPHPPTTAPVAQGGGGGRGGGGGGGPVGGGAMQPMSAAPRLTTLDGPAAAEAAPAGGGGAGFGGGGRGGGGGGRGGGRGGGAPAMTPAELGVTSQGAPRVILTYPTDANDLLLSGELVGGENLTGRPVVVDSQVGKGHAVQFATRPFWRFQTQGNFFLAFNAMLNWDHLDAGKK